MKKLIATIAAVVLTVGLGTASAEARHGDRYAGPRFADDCVTPYELSRVNLGDSPRKVRRKITARHHRSEDFRRIMIPKLCRYRAADRGAAAFIKFRRSNVVFVYSNGGSFGEVRNLWRKR